MASNNTALGTGAEAGRGRQRGSAGLPGADGVGHPAVQRRRGARGGGPAATPGRGVIEKKHSNGDRACTTSSVNAYTDLRTRFIDSTSVECLLSTTLMPGADTRHRGAGQQSVRGEQVEKEGAKGGEGAVRAVPRRRHPQGAGAVHPKGGRAGDVAHGRLGEGRSRCYPDCLLFLLMLEVYRCTLFRHIQGEARCHPKCLI